MSRVDALLTEQWHTANHFKYVSIETFNAIDNAQPACCNAA